ncbi:hypothetical protein DPMN_083331 [Dreissena polymorpha]|uniref:Uncharacterized protein n=1 Tax=Dreissena polymorpha TaxID=45954 RepID=A0A9D4BJQ5_DREPO|nr:hypothetical protein DPMN_083331 [Dreissena polymorpha]
MVVIAGYAVSSAQLGRHHGLYRQELKQWSSSRVIPSASQTMVIIMGYTVCSANHGGHCILVVIAGYTVSSAKHGRHHCLYRQHLKQ